jgi:uncharacterized membrane protein YbhN (UPF0104 family)
MPASVEVDDPVSLPTARRANNPSWRPWLSRVLIGAAVLLSATLLYRTLSRYDPGEIIASIGSIPGPRLLLAVAWAAASYVCLTFNDWLALRYVGKPQSYPYAALTSFVSLSFGHNIGFAALSSGAIRYRIYDRKGVDGEGLAKIIVFCGTTIFLGMFILGDIALLLRPDFGQTITGLSPAVIYALGGGLLVFPIAYLSLAYAWRTRHRIWRWSVEIPDIRLALAQIAVGTINFSIVAACLHALVGAGTDVGYFAVLAAFVIANAATIITHTPGGLGVIETVVILLLRRPELIGAVLAFRFAYYLVPLGLGAITFALAEAIWRRK